MGRRLRQLLRTVPADAGDHPTVDQLLQLGRRDALDTYTRRRLMAHVAKCPACLAMAREAIALADSGALPRQSLWRRPALALAASLMLCVLTAVLMLDGQSSAPLTALVAIDGPLQTLLLQNSHLEWQDPRRMAALATLLRQQGLAVDSLTQVTLTEPYYATKSLFGPPEKLRVQIEKGVARLTVVRGSEDDETRSGE